MRSVAILFIVTNFAFSSAFLHGVSYVKVPADNVHCNVTYVNADVTITDGCNGYCFCDWLEEVYTTEENGYFIFDYDTGNMRIKTYWIIENELKGDATDEEENLMKKIILPIYLDLFRIAPCGKKCGKRVENLHGVRLPLTLLYPEN